VNLALNLTSDDRADPPMKKDIFKSLTRTPGIYKQMRKAEPDINLMASFEVPAKHQHRGQDLSKN